MNRLAHTDAVAIDAIVLHLDLLVRYPSCVGRSSRQPDARSNVASMEEFTKQVSCYRQHHPPRLHRCDAVVLRVRPLGPSIPTREASKAIYRLVGGFWRYPYRSARVGRPECRRWWTVVQDSEHRSRHAILDDVGYHVHPIVLGLWYYRAV